MSYQYKNVPITDLILFGTAAQSSGKYTNMKEPIAAVNTTIENSLPINFKVNNVNIVGVAKHDSIVSTGSSSVIDTTKIDKVKLVAFGGGGGGGGHGGQGNDDGPGTGADGTPTNGGWGYRGQTGAGGYIDLNLTSPLGRYARLSYTIGNGGPSGNTGGKLNNVIPQYRTGLPGNVGGVGNATVVNIAYSNSQTFTNPTAETEIYRAPGGNGGAGGPGGGNKSNAGPVADSNSIASVTNGANLTRLSGATLYGVNSDTVGMVIGGTSITRGGFQGGAGQAGAVRVYYLRS